MKVILVSIVLLIALEVVNGGNNEALICQKCACSSQIPFLIDCTLESVEIMPLLASDFDENDETPFELRLIDMGLVEIQPLPKLPIVKISFHKNSISSVSDTAFANLLNLTEIDLSYNNLAFDSISRDTFLGQFSEDEYLPLPITVLRLGNNDFHSFDKDSFDHLPFLEVLELNDNPLKVIDHQTSVAVTTLRKLKVLNLASTGISKLPDGFLHALPKLSSLVLANNQFSSVPSELENAKALESLNLNNNPIITLQQGAFKGLENVKELNISAMNELTSIDEEAFGPLKSLEILRCSFNPNLSFIATDAFFGIGDAKNAVKLREVHFRGNGLKYLSQYMLPWEKIDIVDIEENPWKCDCHLKWMITNLVDQISKETPDLTLSLICGGPEELKGKSMIGLSSDENISRCKISSTSGRVPRGQDGSPSLLAVGILGIALCVVGTVAFIVILVKRNALRSSYRANQQVRYVRARLDDAFGDRENPRGFVDEEPQLYGDDKRKKYDPVSDI